MNKIADCRYSQSHGEPLPLIHSTRIRPWLSRRLSRWLCLSLLSVSGTHLACANVAGGGNGAGPNITVVDNGGGFVTMSNGTVSIVINTGNARIKSIDYTCNNGAAHTVGVITVGSPGRENFSFGGFLLGNGSYTYTLAANPATNGGSYADVKLVSTSTNGTFEAHYSMLRGSPGFYTTEIFIHGAGDVATGVGAIGLNSTAPSLFNWLSADDTRNFAGDRGNYTSDGSVPTATHEMRVFLDSAAAGEYGSKLLTAQDHGDQKAWGWSSVGTGGANIGMWTMSNLEYNDGGPLKRDVGVFTAGSGFVNETNTGEVGQGSDGNIAAGEQWTKTVGPWFTYLNNIPAAITDAATAAGALYDDAVAQDAAEKAAWPYTWFNNPNYLPASARGTVTGKLAFHDSGNWNPTIAGTWVGLVQEPLPPAPGGVFDFQKWLKPYQYWVKTDSGGSFTFRNVVPGSNYTMYAFGKGMAGTFMSQNQKDSNGAIANLPLELDIPPASSEPAANPISVTAGTTTALGQVDWTCKRLGATVFEIGQPDRNSTEFRHGEDYWAPEFPAQDGYPTGVWGGQMEFPIDFPSRTVNYFPGKSQWARDWNYILPVLMDTASNLKTPTANINFGLANAPASGAAASLYIAFAGSDYDSADGSGSILVTINGVPMTIGASGVTALQPLLANGFNPPGGINNPGRYKDNSAIHSSCHGPYWDQRITFPSSLLKASPATNAISITTRTKSGQAMIDYLRLELAGYVPPTPSLTTVFAGNNRNILMWPTVPGATRYIVSRATSPTGPFATLANGVLGQVSGSGATHMKYVDTSAVNGTNYYYTLASLNPTGTSTPTGTSNRATPSSANPTAAPAAPTGLQVTNHGNQTVSLSCNRSTGADYYIVSRTTLYPDGVGGAVPQRTIWLDDLVVPGRVDTSVTFTDRTYTDPNTGVTTYGPTNGTAYSYTVQAVGTSGASAEMITVPLPPAPASAPGSLTATRTADKTGIDVNLSWTPVPGATGYAIYRSTTQGGIPLFKDNFVMTTPQSTYKDSKFGATLDANTTYYYTVTAVNSGGISAAAEITSVP